MSIGASIDVNGGAPVTTYAGPLAMANASKGRRSRKRRPGATGAVAKPATAGTSKASTATSEQASTATSEQASTATPEQASTPASSAAPKPKPKPRQKQPLGESTRRGERPQAPWHPLPLSEILILIGAIATVVALRHRPQETALLVVGLVAVGIGTFEVTWREHSSGFRSHTILLALVPVLAFHSLVIAIASAVTNPTVLLSIVLLPFDFALFVFFFRLLRARYLDARQLRTVGHR
jgi:hypothetical protein